MKGSVYERLTNTPCFQVCLISILDCCLHITEDSYCLRYKWIKITIHKTITTQKRPVKLLIPNNIKIGIIHLWIKGYLLNICNLDRSISFETMCLTMVQSLGEWIKGQWQRSPTKRRKYCFKKSNFLKKWYFICNLFIVYNLINSIEKKL